MLDIKFGLPIPNGVRIRYLYKFQKKKKCPFVTSPKNVRFIGNKLFIYDTKSEFPVSSQFRVPWYFSYIPIVYLYLVNIRAPMARVKFLKRFLQYSHQRREGFLFLEIFENNTLIIWRNSLFFSWFTIKFPDFPKKLFSRFYLTKKIRDFRILWFSLIFIIIINYLWFCQVIIMFCISFKK